MKSDIDYLYLYPEFFKNKLTEAAGMFAEEMGEKEVYWNHLVALFDELLVREKDRIAEESDGKIVVQMKEVYGTSKPIYFDESYRAAAGEVLGKPTDMRRNHWIWHEYGEGDHANQKVKTALVAQKIVLGRMYPGTATA
jgi:hypothetical protein